MNLPLYLARRINGSGDDQKTKVSRPAIRIATIGVAVGLAVMIVTVAVVLGFKHTIRDKVGGFGSHILVQNIQTLNTGDVYPISVGDSLMQQICDVPGVRHAERFTLAQGILKTDNDFLGVMFKGVGPEYDLSFVRECLVEGELPQFCDSASQYPLVISGTMADKLQLHPGDQVYAYFIGVDNVRARKFSIAAVYQTNMKRFDDLFCLTDIYVPRRINSWGSDECSGLELLVDDFDQVELTDGQLTDYLRQNRFDRKGNMLASQTILKLYPQVFSWLELLDINVWIILALMVALAGFTMISGLLIIILERTQMIGVLKALGTRNSTIRHTFLWFAVFIIGRGLLWGNLIGIGIVVLQQQTGIVTLDPQTYYVSQVPMELNPVLILLLNVVTLIATVFVLIAPSFLISRIHPARSMRYE